MSGKVRVYEVAKQLNLDPKQVVGLFQAIGVADVRNHMSSVEPEQVERIKRHLEKQRTHDVVEERVRSDGRVIKRRAIATVPVTVEYSITQLGLTLAAAVDPLRDWAEENLKDVLAAQRRYDSQQKEEAA